MSRWKKQLIFPLLRISALFAILGLAYLLWTPGKVVRDGRFDLGTNGVWLQHGWLGDDEWFESLMATWTKEVIDWSGDTAVLFGVPAYDDSGVDYHDPDSENLLHAIRGINAGLNSYQELPKNYRGISIYAEWTMTPSDEQTLQDEFLAR